jgi:putative GTP pyrophosphokinase
MDENELFYGDWLPQFSAAVDSFSKELCRQEKAFAEAGRRFPVEHYKTRLKSANSAKTKLAKLGLPQTVQSAVENLFDIAGIRIICRFFYEVHEMVEIIRSMADVRIVNIKDYVKNPKPNGYRSVHLIVQVPVLVAGKAQRQYVEAQVRTIAMDFWASLEHELKYKKNVADAALMAQELKRCADEIISVDLKMQTLYEWLNDLSFKY